MSDLCLFYPATGVEKGEEKVGKVVGVVRVIGVVRVADGGFIEAKIKHKDTETPDNDIQIVFFATLCFLLFGKRGETNPLIFERWLVVPLPTSCLAYRIPGRQFCPLPKIH